MNRILAALFLGFLTAICVADNKRSLLGKWNWQGTEWGAKVQTLSEYRADQTYHATVTVRFLGQSTTAQCKGTWKWVNSKVLEIEITASDNEKYVKTGQVYRMTDVSITDEKMTYKLDGKVETETRARP